MRSTYVEAHGTGTAVGDPIELRALGTGIRAVRAADTPAARRIGESDDRTHWRPPSGIASVIKAALCGPPSHDAAARAVR